MQNHIWKFIIFSVLCVLYSLGAHAQIGTFDWTTRTEEYPGIRLVTLEMDLPRKATICCLQIDAAHPRIAFKTTGRCENWKENKEETQRNTTRNFIKEYRAQGLEMVAAINADAFSPWPAPWNEKGMTNLLGLAVSDGLMVSPASSEPSFVVYIDGTRKLTHMADKDVSQVQLAVSAFSFVLEDGIVTAEGTDINPRTGLGLSKDTRWIYWVVIDGRRHASQGATTKELGAWLLHFGADDGLNLDGGGSSTLAVWRDNKVELINSPVGNGVNWLDLPSTLELGYFPTERNNGNNLGVYLTEK